MRYSVSQEAVASGDISRDQVLTEGNEFSSLYLCFELEFFFSVGTMGGAGDGPLKADGTPDMRFSVNQ